MPPITTSYFPYSVTHHSLNYYIAQGKILPLTKSPNEKRTLLSEEDSVIIKKILSELDYIPVQIQKSSSSNSSTACAIANASYYNPFPIGEIIINLKNLAFQIQNENKGVNYSAV